MADLEHWPDPESGVRALARAISYVENEKEGYRQWLSQLKIAHRAPVIGITGPPGAGKSTLVNALLNHWTAQNKRVGIIAVDPSSPFHLGALLGDRIRMAAHYTNPNIYIRSLASRGSLGGLSAKTIEVSEVMQAAGFDYIVVETVGVGQSEIEVSGLADSTVVVLVPESGDEIQGLKSGIMEIADVFVVNKADRPGAKEFIINLRKLMRSRHHENDWQTPVLSAIASQGEGIEELAVTIEQHLASDSRQWRRPMLLAEKAWHLLQQSRMKNFSKKNLADELAEEIKKDSFNLYAYVEQKLNAIHDEY